MSEDSFTEVTSQSWFSRIIESIKGVLFGLVLFVVAFPVLFWNEGRAVKTAKSLEEGAGAVVSVSADEVDSANDKKLVHMTGEATTTETLVDPDFGISVNAIKLTRNVEMYQWKEDQKSETKKKLGGGTEKKTTYSYSKTWSSRVIDSSSFKQPDGHQNPGAMPVGDDSSVASNVTVGAFTLSPAQVGMMNESEDLRVDEEAAAALPEATRSRATPFGGGYYFGADPSSPTVGDARVTFQVVRPTTVSLIANQVGNTFEAYKAQAGDSILILKEGVHSAEALFEAAQAANVTMTWILRVVGFFVMFIGLVMIFKPVEVLADVIPFIGTMLGAGLSLFAGMIAAVLSLFTIAIAWLFYRPLLGIMLLLLAGGGLAFLISLGIKKKKARAAAAA